MLDWMFICLFIFALLFMLLIIFMHDSLPRWWIFSLTILDTVLWWVLALVNTEIEIPYTMVNSTTGFVEEGYHVFHSRQSAALIYILSAPAVLMMCYMVYQIFEIVTKGLNLKIRWK